MYGFRITLSGVRAGIARPSRGRSSRGRLLVLAAALLGSAAASGADITASAQYGLKYSPLTQITKDNVQDLELAWEYHTGEVSHDTHVLDAFEDEPSLIDGSLVICTTTRRLIALDPATGKQRWIYDPHSTPSGVRKCRGIASWTDSEAAPDTTCRTRILLGTSDYRLIAVDSKTGRPCPGFGTNGVVQMQTDKPQIFAGEVTAGSRPAVVNGVVVVGSSVADDQRALPPSGRVLAFDARTGKPRWQFDPIPRDPKDPAMGSWFKGTNGLGGANVWSEMAVDEKLDLVYLPTTGPSVNFYGGNRPGNNHYSSSIVAVRGATGEVVWHFQFTHHNIWDYDTPAQPLLMDLPYNGKTIPAVVQLTKTGLIWIFNRANGKPLLPYVERPVPQHGAVPGEWLSPTQPFPVGMPPLVAQKFTPDDAWGFTFLDRNACKRKVESLLNGPIYTPPSLKGTVLQPAASGGPNWGGGAYDPATHTLVVPTNRVPMVVTVIPRQKLGVTATASIETRGKMQFPNSGGPYVTQIEPLLSPLGTPCSAPPWAALTAVDLTSGEVRWEVPLGSIEKLAPVPIPWELGTPGAGGPLVTAGGVVFIGYTLDDKIRAFDLHSGKTLWKHDLPAAGMATPVTYESEGSQYIVLTAGGHSMYGSSKGDSVVAYKLRH